MLAKTFFTFLFTLLVLMGHCAADDTTSTSQEAKKNQAVEEGKEGLSLPRKIAGYTVLGVLVIWLFARGAGRGEEVQDDEYDSADAADD